MGLSVSLDIANTALRAQQLGVDVTSHNIANANTPGFSRQELRLQAEIRAQSGLSRNTQIGEAGAGVNAEQITRIRDQFVDFQIREVLQSFGQYNAEARDLEQVEVILNEPGENGLANLFTNFWNSWRDVANAPESLAGRAAILAESETLVASVRQSHDQLVRLRGNLNDQVRATTAEINSLASNVANLNQQIQRMEASGGNASDLHDQRDLALDKLSEFVNVTFAKNDAGHVNVLIGGVELVTAGQVHLLDTVSNPANSGFLDVVWKVDGFKADITSGSLAGHLNIRDTGIVNQLGRLNTLIAQVITDVNAIHQTGFGLDNTTGEDFFTGTDASNVGINAVLKADTRKIGVATGLDRPGDAGMAMAIGDLQRATSMNGGTTSFDDYYRASVGELGVELRETRGLASNQDFLRDHLETLRQSVAGVSLDEEMTNLIKFQRAFEAAARLISVVDSMLDTLVNRTGIVGR